MWTFAFLQQGRRMDVFIGNLPADGKLVELEELLGLQVLHSRFEMRAGRDCFDKSYHYFVIYTDSDDEGWALIKRLNGMKFKANRIIAREFHQRVESNLPAGDWDREERRVNDPLERAG